MEITLFPQDSAPQPPERVRIENLSIQVMPESRIRIRVQLTPFLIQPNVAFLVRAPSGSVVASTVMLQCLTPTIAPVLHLPSPTELGTYAVQAHITFGEEQSPRTWAEATFVLSE